MRKPPSGINEMRQQGCNFKAFVLHYVIETIMC